MNHIGESQEIKKELQYIFQIRKAIMCKSILIKNAKWYKC